MASFRVNMSENIIEKENIRLIDPDTNIQYDICTSKEDAQKAMMDNSFARMLLYEAKSSVRTPIHDNHIVIENDSSNYQRINDVLNRISPETEETVDDPNDPTVEHIENMHPNDQHVWTIAETLLLLSIYKELEETFSSGKISAKHCWEIVSKKMANHGHNIAGHKCLTKFQTLKRTYKKIKDHNNKSGNDTCKWEYYENMNELFAKRPWIQPVATAGTSCKELNNEEEDNMKKTNQRKRKSTIELNNYIEKFIKEKKENREDINRRHVEKMAQLKNIENIFLRILEK